MVSRTHIRHGRLERYFEADPVLLYKEIGVEVETGLQKIGDGIKRWSLLPYYFPVAPRGTEVVATEYIPANSMVTVDGRVANTTIPSHAGAVLGYSQDEIKQGFSGVVITSGTVRNLIWEWNPTNTRLFLNGTTLSEAMPSSANWVLQVAKIYSTDTVEFFTSSGVIKA